MAKQIQQLNDIRVLHFITVISLRIIRLESNKTFQQIGFGLLNFQRVLGSLRLGVITYYTVMLEHECAFTPAVVWSR